MQFLRGATCAVVATLFPISATAAPERSAPLLVRAAVSGDTVDIAGVGHVRLAGIRAPKIAKWAGGSEAYAEDARRRLASIAVERWVRLERVPGGGGRSGYVWTEDGVLINALMLREGLAQLSDTGRVSRGDELAAAEAEARRARRGIWSGGTGTTRDPGVIRMPRARAKPRASRSR